MTLEETLERFRTAANAMARGDADGVKAVYSHADDVTLANPFGQAVRGWADVAAALDYVSARFSDGQVMEFNTIARYETAGLVTFLIAGANGTIGSMARVAPSTGDRGSLRWSHAAV